MGFPSDLESQGAQIADGATRPVDIGRVSIPAATGLRRTLFRERMSGGDRRRSRKEGPRRNKRLGGTLAFGLATLAAAWTSPNRKMTVSVDGAPPITGPFAVVCANGKAMAGGMHLAPAAEVDDGFLDILFMHGQTRTERLRNFPRSIPEAISARRSSIAFGGEAFP